MCGRTSFKHWHLYFSQMSFHVLYPNSIPHLLTYVRYTSRRIVGLVWRKRSPRTSSEAGVRRCWWSLRFIQDIGVVRPQCVVACIEGRTRWLWGRYVMRWWWVVTCVMDLYHVHFRIDLMQLVFIPGKLCWRRVRWQLVLLRLHLEAAIIIWCLRRVRSKLCLRITWCRIVCHSRCICWVPPRWKTCLLSSSAKEAASTQR